MAVSLNNYGRVIATLPNNEMISHAEQISILPIAWCEKFSKNSMSQKEYYDTILEAMDSFDLNEEDDMFLSRNIDKLKPYVCLAK